MSFTRIDYIAKTIEDMAPEIKSLSDEQIMTKLNNAKECNKKLNLLSSVGDLIHLCITLKNPVALLWISQNFDYFDFYYFSGMFNELMHIKEMTTTEQRKNIIRNIINRLGNEYKKDFSTISPLFKIAFYEGLDTPIQNFITRFKIATSDYGFLNDIIGEYSNLPSTTTLVLSGFLAKTMNLETVKNLLNLCLKYSPSLWTNTLTKNELQLALEANNIELMNFLREKFSLDINSKLVDGTLPLEKVINAKNWELTKHLVQNCGAILNEYVSFFKKDLHSPLLKKIANQGKIDAVKILIKLGAECAFESKEGSVLPLKHNEIEHESKEVSKPRVNNFLNLVKIIQKSAQSKTDESTLKAAEEAKAWAEAMPKEDQQDLITLYPKSNLLIELKKLIPKFGESTCKSEDTSQEFGESIHKSKVASTVDSSLPELPSFQKEMPSSAFVASGSEGISSSIPAPSAPALEELEGDDFSGPEGIPHPKLSEIKIEQKDSASRKAISPTSAASFSLFRERKMSFSEFEKRFQQQNLIATFNSLYELTCRSDIWQQLDGENLRAELKEFALKNLYTLYSAENFALPYSTTTFSLPKEYKKDASFSDFEKNYQKQNLATVYNTLYELTSRSDIWLQSGYESIREKLKDFLLKSLQSLAETTEISSSQKFIRSL